MANYNSKRRYNFSPNKLGLKYNSAPYMLTVRFIEPLNFLDEVKLLSSLFFSSDILNLNDKTKLESDYNLIDINSVKDIEYKLKSEYNLDDDFGFLSESIKFLVYFLINDKITISEKLKLISEVFSTDNISIIEKNDLNVFLQSSDKYKTIDLSPELNAAFRQFDIMNVTDKEPKYAISDFYVTRSEDGLYDVILPFDLIVDYSMTHIGFMPECQDSTIEMEGVDGEIVQNSTYKSRLFDIFAVTVDGLNRLQKAQIKKDIAQILNSVKTQTKKITFADNETSFDVKYSGLADVTTEAPSWLRFEIPLKSSSSYGYKEFIKDLYGSGLITNDGDKSIGAVHKITGQCVNPTFYVNNTLMTWKGTVKSGETLYIDTDNYTCYIVDSNGKRINAMKNYNGNFPRIPIGSVVLSANPSTEDHIYTQWRELVLY